jgi:hypothetical protein
LESTIDVQTTMTVSKNLVKYRSDRDAPLSPNTIVGGPLNLDVYVLNVVYVKRPNIS